MLYSAPFLLFHSVKKPSPQNVTPYIYGWSTQFTQPNLENSSQTYPEACFHNDYKSNLIDSQD